MRPVPHSEDLPIPHLPTHLTLEDKSEHEAATKVLKEEQDDATFETSTSSCEPHLLTEGELNDLVRDLKLSKKQAEILGSRLLWRPENVAQLRAHIMKLCRALSEDLCRKVVTNARVRLQEVVRQNGGHIEHVLH